MASHVITSSRRFRRHRLFILLMATGIALPLKGAVADEAAASEPADATSAMPTSSAQADEARPVLGTVGEPESKSEQEASPDRLRKALRERGFSLGFGQKMPLERFDYRTDTTMFQFIPSKGRFRNAKQEFIWEAPLVVFTKPHTDFVAGLTLMFRQHLTSNRRLAPYVEFGVGANLTDLDVREIGGRFQFSLQGGVGIRKAIGKNSDLKVGVRWYHLSNAGTDSPNTGLNNYLITVGYSHLT
jgi:opacity protein-like surface antigen